MLTIETLDRPALIEVILQQQEQIDQLLGKSSRSERRKQKKRDGDGKPGRKKSEGSFSRRSALPPEEYISQKRVEVNSSGGDSPKSVA